MRQCLWQSDSVVVYAIAKGKFWVSVQKNQQKRLYRQQEEERSKVWNLRS